MSLLRAGLCAAGLAAFASTASAASVLASGSPLPDADKLFTTETKVDQNVGGQRRGHDVFVRKGATFTGGSAGKTWTSGILYDWTLTYDGDVASLDVDGSTASFDVLDGSWNSFTLITRANNRTRKSDGAKLFSDAKSEVSITGINGHALSTPLTQTALLDQFVESSWTLADFGPITAMTGTLLFDWTATDSSLFNGSPNSALGFGLKAGNVAPIPLPAAAPMLIGALGGLGVLSRRRRKTA